MKKFKIILLMITLIITVFAFRESSKAMNQNNLDLTSSHNISKESTIDISDENLIKALKSSLMLTEDQNITEEEMKKLKTLNLSYNNINNLKGLEYAVHLISLDLSNNAITDISSLKSLENLEILSLSNNKAQDISVLGNLTKLNFLDLNKNQISNISLNFKEIKNLTTLKIADNRIEDISFIKDLTSIQFLDISNNQIKNISYLKNLSNLTCLFCKNNKIEDISCLVDLENLWKIDNNTIENKLSIEKLREFGYLEYNNVKSIKTCSSSIFYLENFEIERLNDSLIEKGDQAFQEDSDNNCFLSQLKIL